MQKSPNLTRYTSVFQNSFLVSFCLLFAKPPVISLTIAQFNYQPGVMAEFILRFGVSIFLQFFHFQNLLLNLQLICQPSILSPVTFEEALHLKSYGLWGTFLQKSHKPNNSYSLLPFKDKLSSNFCLNNSLYYYWMPKVVPMHFKTIFFLHNTLILKRKKFTSSVKPEKLFCPCNTLLSCTYFCYSTHNTCLQICVDTYFLEGMCYML